MRQPDAKLRPALRASPQFGVGLRLTLALQQIAVIYSHEHTMRYNVALKKTDEGFSVSCPGLPGCWSQGNTEQEALENIAEAITEYLSVSAELAQAENAEVREVEVVP